MSFELIKRRVIKQGRLANILWPLRSNGLYCFNFHRVGDVNNTPFDPCVYSCDAENFQLYLDFFQSNFRIIDLKELCSIIQTGTPIKEKLALITFDDGYLDNYEVAFPRLKAMGIPATFFVTTSLIGSTVVPWWDEIAWHVKQFSGQSFKLSIWPEAISLPEKRNASVIRKVLSRVKSFPTQIDLQLNELRELTNKKMPVELTENLFMKWEHLSELEKNGISIGAHSHTHRILSSLTNEDLIYELTESKELLEKYLGKSVASLSYPVGGESSYHSSMFKLLDDIGYQVGFTFRNLVNRETKNKNYEIGRLSIDRAFDEKFLKEMILSSPKL
ncbi:polysaccharide deacetylase family protein [Thalassotalea piscium]